MKVPKFQFDVFKTRSFIVLWRLNVVMSAFFEGTSYTKVAPFLRWEYSYALLLLKYKSSKKLSKDLYLLDGLKN